MVNKVWELKEKYPHLYELYKEECRKQGNNSDAILSAGFHIDKESGGINWSDTKQGRCFWNDVDCLTEEEFYGKYPEHKPKNYDYEVVHCTTQEQWDFVCSKIKPWVNLRADFLSKGFNTMRLDGEGWLTKEWFENKKPYVKIYTFQEWCEKFGHTLPVEKKCSYYEIASGEEDKNYNGNLIYRDTERFGHWDKSSKRILRTIQEGVHFQSKEPLVFGEIGYQKVCFAKKALTPSTKEKYLAQFEEKPKFEAGKWYKHFAYEGTYAKFEKMEGRKFIGTEWICRRGEYEKHSFESRLWTNAKEVTLEEIQQYLPEGHTDKIIKSTDMTEELLEEARRRYPIGTIFKSPQNNNTYKVRYEADYWIGSNNGGVIATVSESSGQYLFFKGQWAEIISGTEVFKVEWIPKVGDWVVGWHDSEPNLYREAWKIKEVRGGLAYPEGKQGWCTGVENIRKAELHEVPTTVEIKGMTYEKFRQEYPITFNDVVYPPQPLLKKKKKNSLKASNVIVNNVKLVTRKNK